MSPLTKILMFLGLFLLLILTAVAAYSYSQIRVLSLSISQVLAIITLILPLATVLSTQAAWRLRTHNFRAWPAPYVAIFAFQLIYETIIATLSLTYMVPNCRLEEQWARLYKNKDGGAIRRIQDRFNCCGLNSAIDRAWPFPHGRPEDGFGADQCERMFGRGRACSGPWRQAERINAGLLFTVALVIFVVKFVILIFQLWNTSSWMRFFGPLAASEPGANFNNHPNPRLMIHEDSATVGERYHDEVVDGDQDAARGNLWQE